MEEPTLRNSGSQQVREPRSSQSQFGDFPGGPVVKTPGSLCRGHGSIPGWGAKIPHAM